MDMDKSSVSIDPILPPSSNSSTTSTNTTSFDLTSVTSLWTSLATFSGLGPDWLKLVVLGGIVETFRRLLSTAWAKIIAGFFLTAEIDQNDKAYQWMMAWLSMQSAWNASREIEINARQNKRSISEGLVNSDDEDGDDEESKGKGVKYLPGYGVKVNVWFEGTWIQVSRVHKELGNGWNSTNHELLVIQMMTRSHKTLSRLLKHARRQYSETTDDRIDIYTASTYNEWTYASSRQRRPLESVVLDAAVKNRLLGDAKDFLASEKWYSGRGIPWRRGYLLHGSPGSGKTSIIHALAGELGCDVYVFSLAKKGLDDSDLCQLVADLPPRSLALMEDIDVAFYRGVTREAPVANPASNTPTPGAPPTTDAVPTPSSGITLAGLLSAIDGVAAQEGRILFATTNKYDALDPALCRPGRFDVHIEFGLAEQKQAEELFRCFYPATKDESEEGEKDDDSATPTLVDGEAGEKNELSPPSYSSSPATPTTTTTAPAPASDRKPAPSLAPQHHFDTLPSVYTPLAPSELTTLSLQFASHIPARTFSMAALQGLLMQYKTDPHAAVDAAEGWVKTELEKKNGKKENDGKEKEKEEMKKKEEEAKKQAVMKKALLWELWNRVVSTDDLKANASI